MISYSWNIMIYYFIWLSCVAHLCPLCVEEYPAKTRSIIKLVMISFFSLVSQFICLTGACLLARVWQHYAIFSSNERQIIKRYPPTPNQASQTTFFDAAPGYYKQQRKEKLIHIIGSMNICITDILCYLIGVLRFHSNWMR